MEIAIIEYFPQHGFEVWVTDVIEIGAGLGDVFDTYNEAKSYAEDHKVPIVDLTHIERPFLEGENLREYLRRFLEISRSGEIISIKIDQNC